MRERYRGLTMVTVAASPWIRCGWEEFLERVASPELQKAKCFYDTKVTADGQVLGWMRVDMSPVGPIHAGQGGFLAALLGYLLTFRYDLDYLLLDNATFRLAGEREVQPDLALYLSSPLPKFTLNTPINLKVDRPPDLAIELAATTLQADLDLAGLYGAMGVREYWVVDVTNHQITAFTGTGIQPVSQVLPGLAFTEIEAALRLCQSVGQKAALRSLA